MNITKTNMLSLDNKIKKDGAVNAVEQAPALSKTHSNAGINALMFQGMQNLMANPMLAKKTGVMNDEPKAEETEAAKSYVAPYSSNIAFQGTATKTMKIAAFGAFMALAGLTSCTKDKTEVVRDPVHVEQNVNVEVDLSPVTALLTSIQTTLLQMMIQQQDNGFLLQDQLDEIKELQAQLAQANKDAKAQRETMISILKTISSKVFDLDNHLVAGFNKNNAYHEAVIAYLSQFMTRDEAIYYFDKLYGQVVSGTISIDDAMNEIINKWDETNSKIDETNDNLNDIKSQLAQLNQTLAEWKANYDVDVTGFQSAMGDLYRLLGRMYVDGKNRTQIAQMINMKMSALLADVEKIKATAIDMRNKMKQGVSIDYNQLETMFKILNMNQQEAIAASTEAIVTRLDAFIDGQEKIEKAIKLLDMNNGARTNYLAFLIKNKTSDNADVIEAINNLAAANEANIAAATEELAKKLDTLIAKADVALGKMDGLAKLLQQYGDKIYNKLDVDNKAILDQLKANGKKIDTSNMTLAELKAELEKIKPELEKLNANAKDANENLVQIDKDVLAIKQAIADLEAIAGDALTKDELEELWQAHDANAFAKAKAFLNSIHAEDIAKADEIIEYLKKGNKTAGDTYELLLDFANKANLKADDLKKLLQAVYDYLPELKCQCNCQGDCGHNQQTHEGIIGVLS